jgi:hypothetical protein
MSTAFLVNYVTGRRQITNVKVDGKKYISRKLLCFDAPWSWMLFVNGADDHDHATTCAFSRGCCEVNTVNTVCGGLSHLKNMTF